MRAQTLTPRRLVMLSLMIWTGCASDPTQEPQAVEPSPKDPAGPMTPTTPAARPTLKLLTPAQGASLEEPSLEVTFQAQGADANAYSVRVGAQAPSRVQGRLAQGQPQRVRVALPGVGLHVITLTVYDSQGAADSRELVVVVESPEAPRLRLHKELDGLSTYEPTVALHGEVLAQRPLRRVELIVNGVPRDQLIAAEGSTETTLALAWEVALDAGQNTLELIATDLQGVQGRRVMVVTRQRDERAPELRVTWPRQDQSVTTRQVYLRGVASDEDEVARVELEHGDQRVQAQLDALGQWSAPITLNTSGSHQITITATDRSGQQTRLDHTLHLGQRLAAGGAHGGALIQGQLWTWGRNNKGQVGLGFLSTQGDAQHPQRATKVAGVMTSFDALAFSQNASVALDERGEVWAWGDNANGQLCLGLDAQGQPDLQDRLIPTKVNHSGRVVALTRGFSHTMWLREDGTVWTCGRNNAGQLGVAELASSAQPVQVPGLSDVIQISAGSESSFAVDAQGRVWAWGRNRFGNLGQGAEDTAAHPTPTQVPGLTRVIMLAQGRDHTLALTADGEVYGWGLNASAQAGSAAAGNLTSPTKLSLGLPAVAVYANGNQSFFEDAQGRLWGWGQNGQGNLGIPLEADQPQPTAPVFGVEGVLDVAIGPLHGFARQRDGVILAWGWSFEGSLGGGDTIIPRWGYRIPVLVQFAP